MKYNLAVTFLDHEGLKVNDGTSTIALDGRVYHAGGGAHFAIEDLSNLINMNSPQNSSVPGLLNKLGVSGESDQFSYKAEYRWYGGGHRQEWAYLSFQGLRSRGSRSHHPYHDEHRFPVGFHF